MARWGDLEVSVGDLDDHVLRLPASARPAPGTPLDDWYAEQVRQILVERRLAGQAREEQLDQSAGFLAARAEAERRLALQLCLARLVPGDGDVSEDALRAAYAERADGFSSPERRATLHLFLRAAPSGAEREAAWSRIEALRDRVLGGESFRVLAAEHSDSEARHREGSLGWLVPGQVPAGFEDVVFGLEEGVPSEPVATRDGLHLFLVERILPARQLDYDEVRARLREQLLAERREAAVAAIEAEIEPPPDSLLLDGAGLAEAVRGGDPERTVLRVADQEVTVGELGRLLQRLRDASPAGAGGRQPALTGWGVLQQLRRGELLRHHCRVEGLIAPDALAEALERWQRQALPALQRQRRMLELAKRDDARLRLFFESNAGQFGEPPAWHLRRLRIPLGEQASAVMARLEDAAGDPGPLEKLQAELGGEIEDLGMLEQARIGRLDPRLPALVAPLRPGRISAPYRSEEHLEIVEVVDKRMAGERPYEEVRDEVAAAYVAQYTHEVYERLATEVLAGHDVRLVPEGIAAAREAGVASEDVSVEQIEALFDSQ